MHPEPKWHKTHDAPTMKPPTNQTVGFTEERGRGGGREGERERERERGRARGRGREREGEREREGREREGEGEGEGGRGSVEANDDFQRQFSPSCNFSEVV